MIPTPFANTQSFDISPDRSELLVGSSLGAEPLEYPVWTVPFPTGSPRRVANIMAHDGTWSPDGRQLIYANGHDLYSAKSDGSEARKLLTAAGTAHATRFSPDGRHLRFTVRDAANTNSLWEASADGTGLHPLLGDWTKASTQGSGQWTPDGAYYLFTGADNSGQNIWALPASTELFRKSGGAPIRVTTGPLHFDYATSGRDARRVFVIGSQPRGELVRYDSRTSQFLPFLSGLAAEEVDFSPDGQWVTYGDISDGTLWRSRVDVSERFQLTYPPEGATLPRWSPDGKQIVFCANRQGKPWRLALVSAQGGVVQQLLSENRNLVDPTWSASGREIAFGEDAAADSDIRVLDVSTRQLSTLPASKGLFSPRWSPDGRYLAALSADSQKLMLFDFGTQNWIVWADEGHSLGFPSWSRDSKYIYYDWSFGKDPSFRRLKLGEHKSEQLLSLKGLRRYFNWMASWAGIAPDGTPLFVRDTSTQEIYALQLQ